MKHTRNEKEFFKKEITMINRMVDKKSEKWRQFVKRQAGRMVLTMIALCLSAPLQAAETYGFGRISNTSSANPEGQLFMDVSAAGSDQVLFHFYNVGPIPSSICNIYFDNGTPGSPLVSIAGITDSGPGVDFGIGATPGKFTGR